MRVYIFVLILSVTLPLMASITPQHDSVSNDVIVCKVDGHPIYSEVIVNGSNQIGFERIDGKDTSVLHDGYKLRKSYGSYFAVYRDTQDLLFFISKDGYGLVQAIGVDEDNDLDMETDYYEVSECMISQK